MKKILEADSPRRLSTLYFQETGLANAAWEYKVAVVRVCYPA